MLIASFPKVGVKVHSQGDTLVRITLFLASDFILDCSSPTLQRSLLPWLESYAEHKWEVFPLPLPKTPFSQKVASHLQTIPPGEVITYQALAEATGHPGAARAVGNFCQGNLFPLFIPCHRVVPSNRGLGSFTPDPQIKQQLLQFEGVLF